MRLQVGAIIRMPGLTAEVVRMYYAPGSQFREVVAEVFDYADKCVIGSQVDTPIGVLKIVPRPPKPPLELVERIK